MSVLQKKISKLARFDGVSLWIMGVLSLGLAMIWRDMTGAMVGLALITLGAIELTGRRYLLNFEKRATIWLVGSQMGLLAVIMAYCLRNIYFPPALPLEPLPPEMLLILENLPGYNGDLAGLLQPMVKVFYSLIMLISVFYQGNMALFYLRKTPLAVQQPPPIPAD